jgi:diguanylate cyclase (GGDEF)-like protein
MIAISETTSLDYLIQLPRMIEEAGRKRLLRFQNERLQRLLQHRMPTADFGPNPRTEIIKNEKVLTHLMNSQCLDGRSEQCGLKIQLKHWRRFSKNLGDIAQNEVLELVSRMINKSVRNSDRVLRSKEDEFTIFLSHTDVSNLNRCKERIHQTLSEIRILSNQNELELPFSISSIEHLSPTI